LTDEPLPPDPEPTTPDPTDPGEQPPPPPAPPTPAKIRCKVCHQPLARGANGIDWTHPEPVDHDPEPEIDYGT